MFNRSLILIPILILGVLTQTNAFSSVNNRSMRFAQFTPFDQTCKRPHSTSLYMSTLPDIESMRASELRKELQSYGISTKSFFEKSELVDAVKKAREEGKTPTSESPKKEADSSSGNESNGKESRKEKLEAEIAKCSSMRVGELKKELESLGISTKSFFEKSEFVRALAEARVDGVKGKKSTGAGRQTRKEDYDPNYRDVVMQKMNLNPRDPRWGGSTIIDVRLK